MYLTNKEAIWLQQHGGRNETDVLVDEEHKKYVLMHTPHGDEKVYMEV